MRLKPGSAAKAWAKGLEGGAHAAFWLARARRLAPDDPRIALDLARQLLAGDAAAQARARAEFTTLATRHDIGAAWTGLALAALKLGDAQAAAAALNEVLTRYCLDEAPGFTAFAAHVAAAAGYGGFRGVTATGQTVKHGSGRLLGARPDHAALARVEGLAGWEADGISGWACRLAWPDAPPALTLTDAAGRSLTVKFGKPLKPDDTAPLLPRHRFRVSPRQLRDFIPPFALRGPDGRDIMGSPLDPGPLATAPVPAAQRGTPPARAPRRARLALLMPVYRGLKETRAALGAALAAADGAEVIVVDDATPEPAIARFLDAQAAAGRIQLLRHETNRGFCAAVNTGLGAARGRDVLLLNADILLPPGAVATLRALAYADAATGTVTPLANEATICSYPSPQGGNPMPDLRETTRLDILAQATNRLAIVEIPTSVGFCMYIRHDCLKAVGGLRGEIFAQGYGEENDFCLRARHLGFRHVAAPGAYVAHQGGVSFRAGARGLIERNLAILNQLYPGYHAMILAHIAADPLRPYRTALDEARLRAATGKRDAVLLITHSHGGGVARQVAAEMESWRAKGIAPLLLTTQFPSQPAKTPYPWPALLCAGEAADYPNLAFPLPEGWEALLRLLRELRVRRVVLHHMLGHHADVRGIARALDVPQDIVVHDYACFCPRVNLLIKPERGAPPRYCGEPDQAGCIACRAKGGDLFETLPIPKLLARSAAEFAAAAAVIVPSADAAKRLARHFPGVKPEIRPWENDTAPLPLHRPRSGGVRRIAVIGGIGPSKGFALLRDCAEDARARALPLEFYVVGASADDAALLEAGVFVTGAYREGEAGALIAAMAPDLAFLPSIWPETWCFALSEAWRAGLPAVVFDLGAQAERVRATGRGLVLPLGLPPGRVNDVLLNVS
jgi:GT2 family glycosyltransferase/glycosyltransferase involved in cell wall biosynthesis